MEVKKKRIECYSAFLLGHTIPLAKMAEILQRKHDDYDITIITFEITKQRLEKEFPTLKFEGIKHEFTFKEQRELSRSPPHVLFPILFSQFKEYFENKKDFPDLIIADVFLIEAMSFAKKNAIKLIVNVPNSYGSALDKFNFVTLERSQNIEGFLINYSLPKNPILGLFDQIMESFKGWGRILFHSFFGLDEPAILPPNHSLIGILPNRSNTPIPEELASWINNWKAKGKNKFLYVSFGSIIVLSEQFIKKLVQIFEQLGYPVIWSLKSAGKEAIESEIIFHREWLPQLAILRLPQVRGYLTHCGWGSISEAVSTSTPLACVPVFADQPSNANLVVKKHIGVQIYETNSFAMTAQVSLDIKDERILTGVTELMENDSYYHAIERLNRMSKLHKTEENICLVVEETLQFGNEHLICTKYESATEKKGQPLSKILINAYLPPVKALHH